MKETKQAKTRPGRPEAGPGRLNPKVKQKLKERIARLSVALDQAQNEDERHEVQFLLDRAKGDYQKYLIKERKWVAMVREKKRVQEERDRKRQRQHYILAAVLVVLGIVLFFGVNSFLANRREKANQSAANAAFQAKDEVEQQQAESAAGNRLGDDELLPKNLIGTWTGTQGGVQMTMIFAEDGTVTTKVATADGSFSQTTGAITYTERIDDSAFKIVGYSGVVAPSMLDADVDYGQIGFKLGDGGKTLYPIHWESAYSSSYYGYDNEEDEDSSSSDSTNYQVDDQNVFVKSE